MKLEYLPDGTRNKLTLDAEEDPALRYEVVNYRELPVSEVGVTVNFPMELCDGSDVGHTAINGATRQIPVRPWLLLTRTIEAYACPQSMAPVGWGQGTHGLGPFNGNPIPGDDEEPRALPRFAAILSLRAPGLPALPHR